MILKFILTLLLFAPSAFSSTVSEAGGDDKLTVLLVNDIYRLDHLPAVRTLRMQLQEQYGPVLLLHAGDFLFPSLLSRKFKGRHMIDIMNQLDGDAVANDPYMLVTFGNHEFEKHRLKQAEILQQRLEESQFDWVSSNIQFKLNGKGVPLVGADNLLSWKIVTINGFRIGVFALTTDSKHPRYVAHFDDPVETARKMTASLRAEGVDLVIALTHLTMAEDKLILDTLKDVGPDIILGGHEHNQQVAKVHDRLVIKADADALSAAVVRIAPQQGRLASVDYHFQALAGVIQADETIAKRVANWEKRYEKEHCESSNLAKNCLQEIVGHTQVELVAEELAIRRFETNFGNWIADQALEHFNNQGARIAFVNSGSLRLNHNIPAAGTISRKTINKLFAYPNHMVVIRINGALLQQIVDRAIQEWSGNGHWLQISGFSFRHNPETNRAEQLAVMTSEGPRLVRPGDEITAVTNFYLVDQKGDQDGYRMLNRDMIIDKSLFRPKLRDIVIRSLQAAEPEGIAPEIDGRIRNLLY